MSDQKTWDKKLDDEIRAFEDELSASIDAFVDPTAAPSPQVAQRGKPPPAPVPVPPPRPTPPEADDYAAPGSDLLAELRCAAQQQNEHDEAAEKERHEREQRVAKAMRALFRYLSELCRHLDTVHVPVIGQYRVSTQAVIEGLTWQDSFIDYRTASSSELAPITRITLRYTLSALGSVSLDCAAQYASRQQEALNAMGLRYRMREHQAVTGKVDACVFDVSREVRISLSMMPNYDQELLIFRTKNFAGFGPADYSIETHQLDQQLFDEIGKYMLGRPNHLLSRLKPERYLRP